MPFDKIKLQRTPEGAYMIVSMDSQFRPPVFHGTEELSQEETTKRLRDADVSESDIRKLFAQAENIARSELIEPSDAG